MLLIVSASKRFEDRADRLPQFPAQFGGPIEPPFFDELPEVLALDFAVHHYGRGGDDPIGFARDEFHRGDGFFSFFF